jgi:hypothetical protein
MVNGIKGGRKTEWKCITVISSHCKWNSIYFEAQSGEIKDAYCNKLSKWTHTEIKQRGIVNNQKAVID